MAKKNLSSKTTKSKPPKPPKPVQEQAPAPVHNPDQQKLLDVFETAFSATLSSPDFPELLQRVKQHLYDRDFAAAFGKEDYLAVYAARWSPTRALCYASILDSLARHLDGITAQAPAPVPTPGSLGSSIAGPSIEASATSTEAPSRNIKMISLGGGTAELAALALHLRAQTGIGSLTLIDSGPWSPVVSDLRRSLTTPKQLSKHASTAALAANAPFLPAGYLNTRCIQGDVLAMSQEQLTLHLAQPCLVTLFFTLNELYTSGGIGPTTAFLLSLSAAVREGTLLLVVDSPGSYSQTAVGPEAKRYPMHWLLEHTLLQKKDTGAGSVCGWEKLESIDSAWFRLPKTLAYPIALEDMRYQMHLYRAVRP